MSTIVILALGTLGGRFVAGLAGFGTGLTALGFWQFRTLVLWLLLASGIVLMVSNLTLAR